MKLNSSRNKNHDSCCHLGLEIAIKVRRQYSDVHRLKYVLDQLIESHFSPRCLLLKVKRALRSYLGHKI